jgi:hypothetical protein
MQETGSVRVCACGSGRVHLQVGFVTLCLETRQLAELVKKGAEALYGSEPAARDGSPSRLAH